MESVFAAGAPNQDLHLPSEVWLLIFEKLDMKSLLLIRMTCRQWRQLVLHSKSLRNKLDILFHRITMDDSYDPQNLFPVSCATFCGVKLLTAGAWWPQFGATLTKLYILSGQIAIPALVALLSATPNLDYLSIIANSYLQIPTEPVELSWRLEKLTMLSCDVLFDVYEQIFPRLEFLNLRLNPDAEKLCRLLDSVQGTLKSLSCEFTPHIVERIAGMSRLKLTWVNLCGQEDMAVEMSRVQPSIEDLLLLKTSNEALFKIGQNLTNLKRITVPLCATDYTLEPTFMTSMQQLTQLTMKASREQSIDFGDFKLPQLKTIRLESLVIEGTSWSCFLANCPKLETISLKNCRLDSWEEVFAPPTQKLLSMTLDMVYVEDDQESDLFNRKFNLQQLSLMDCNLSCDSIVKFIRHTPKLEKLRIVYILGVYKGIVPALKKLRKLKELQISYCELSQDTIRKIYDCLEHRLRALNCTELVF